MKGKSDSKKRKGAKRQDRRPCRLGRSTHGTNRRARANKGPGNRKEAKHRDGVVA